MQFRITVFAGSSITDDSRHPSTSQHIVDSREMDEELRKIGLEYRTSDYFPTRQVVIVIDRFEDPNNRQSVKEFLTRALEDLN